MKETNDGFNRPIFYRKRSVWRSVINRRNAGIVCGALFFTWLGVYLDRLSNLCN